MYNTHGDHLIHVRVRGLASVISWPHTHSSSVVLHLSIQYYVTSLYSTAQTVSTGHSVLIVSNPTLWITGMVWYVCIVCCEE